MKGDEGWLDLSRMRRVGALLQTLTHHIDLNSLVETPARRYQSPAIECSRENIGLRRAGEQSDSMCGGPVLGKRYSTLPWKRLNLHYPHAQRDKIVSVMDAMKKALCLQIRRRQ